MMGSKLFFLICHVLMVFPAVSWSGRGWGEQQVYISNLNVAGAVPSAPKGIFAMPGDNQAIVNWRPVPGATSYKIYMASVSGVTKSNYSRLPDGMMHTGVTSPYKHTGLTNGKTYYFVVTAVNSFGEGQESGEDSARPTPCSGCGGIGCS